jgi:hypothetical protein
MSLSFCFTSVGLLTAFELMLNCCIQLTDDYGYNLVSCQTVWPDGGSNINGNCCGVGVTSEGAERVL